MAGAESNTARSSGDSELKRTALETCIYHLPRVKIEFRWRRGHYLWLGRSARRRVRIPESALQDFPRSPFFAHRALGGDFPAGTGESWLLVTSVALNPGGEGQCWWSLQWCL